MIYQVFYDKHSANCIEHQHPLITPCGVFKSREQARIPGCIYDDEKQPNLTQHNTLCEWRVLYYVWQHHPSAWVGFTSWQHDKKKFHPSMALIDEAWVHTALKKTPIVGFAVWPLESLMLAELKGRLGISLKSQFLQWKIYEDLIGMPLNDARRMPLGKYHDLPYWNFVMQALTCRYGIDIEKELDGYALAGVDALHTWCNAFIADWRYFDGYMRMFSPIVLSMLQRFGSHARDLELAYICERLIIIYNYIQYRQNPEVFSDAATGEQLVR